MPFLVSTIEFRITKHIGSFHVSTCHHVLSCCYVIIVLLVIFFSHMRVDRMCSTQLYTTSA